MFRATRNSHKPLLALSFAVLVSTHAVAQHVSFVATAGDAPLAGAEVCFFRGVKSENPVVLFGQDDRVRCLSADVEHEMRPGTWNFYVQHSSGYVTAYPNVMFVEGRAPLQRAVSMPMRKAGILDFDAVVGELDAGEHFVVYISNVTTETALPAIRPLPHGQTRMFVPAGERVLPLIVNHGRLIRVGEVQTVDADKVVAVRPLAKPKHNTVDVVSWIKVDYTIFERVRDKAALSPFDVVLTTQEGATLRPLLPLRHSTANELSLQVFKNVPLGRHKITLRGETWEAATLSIAATADSPVAMTEEPIRAAPAGKATLRWRLTEAAASLLAPRPSCSDDKVPTTSKAQATLAVLSCPSVSQQTPVEVIEIASCHEVTKWVLPSDEDRGVAIARGLPARVYVAALQLPHVRPVLKTIYAAPGENATYDIEPQIGSIFGQVTRGGMPVHAEIVFSTGSTVSDSATGDYTALLTESPGGDLIVVRPCDGTSAIKHEPKLTIPLNARYDIALENTVVNVTVREARGGAPLAGATIFFQVFDEKKEDMIHFSGASRPTSKDGHASFESLPAAAPIVICAQKRGYADQCSKRFTLQKDEQRETEIKLEPQVAFEGKIKGPSNFAGTMVFWFDQAGGVTEAALVAPDGTFTYHNVHAATEAAVVVSASNPLHLFPGAAQGDRPLEFVFGAEPVRTFSVDASTSGRDTAYIGLWIGGYPIPTEILDRHQSFRHLRNMILRGEPIVIADVAQTAPIEVTLGPDPRTTAKNMLANWFETPTFVAGLPKKALGNANRITF